MLIMFSQVSSTVALICDEDTEENVAEIQDQLEKEGIRVFYWGSHVPRLLKTKDTVTYDTLLGMPATPIDPKYRKGIRFCDLFG